MPNEQMPESLEAQVAAIWTHTHYTKQAIDEIKPLVKEHESFLNKVKGIMAAVAVFGPILGGIVAKQLHWV